MSLLAELVNNAGLLPHKDSFGPHYILLKWYEIAMWIGTLAWIANGIQFAISVKQMPVVIREWVRPLIKVVSLFIGISIIRYALNSIVIHWPWYDLQTVAFMLDAHIVIGIATLGCWYLLRPNDSIFLRMARHKRNSDRFQAMANSTRITGLIEYDEGSNIWFANPAAHRILGYSGEPRLGESLVGEKFTILLPFQDKQVHLDSTEEFIRTGSTARLEAKMPLELTAVRKDGTCFPMEITLSAYKLALDWRFVCIFRDITYRKELEHKLTEATHGHDT